jgi:hypothetical protein
MLLAVLSTGILAHILKHRQRIPLDRTSAKAHNPQLGAVDLR